MPSVKTVEPVVAKDKHRIWKPRFHRQRGATQARSASLSSKKGIRNTKSEFQQKQHEFSFHTDNSRLTPVFLRVDWTALQLDLNFVACRFWTALRTLLVPHILCFRFNKLHRAFSDLTLCNAVFIQTSSSVIINCLQTSTLILWIDVLHALWHITISRAFILFSTAQELK